ncbi:PhzF family phenazine biosynthesis isomerase [Alkalispirochaeta sphaeroplastigenens]|uniref:PhzF family phenazine biosynthesis isomerase n=1 Tax=Alkalispirochaeta sphaeroplastigenens TaxID=1187066 RepID=UPI001FE496C8|nr:PhzF family phenazine biosynthesis isomerase [Alkalispirochaeta sphaeroplastigenens]
MKLVVYQVDSFTQTIFEGNPASVVMNAEKLDDTQMQKIAREMNNSETAFIIPKAGKQYHLEVRFFTPTQEVPICGHATVAAHYVYSRDNDITDREILQKTKAGILPVYNEPRKSDSLTGWFIKYPYPQKTKAVR